MLSYFCGVQRRLRHLIYDVDFFTGPIFDHGSDGFMYALNGRFSEQKSNIFMTKNQNILNSDDIKVIMESKYCDPKRAEGFRNRPIFSVRLAIRARTTEIWRFETAQFAHKNVNGKQAWVYTLKIRENLGE